MGNVRIRKATHNDRFALARIIIDATFSAFHGRVPDQCLTWIDVEESARNWGNSLNAMGSGEHLLVAEVGQVDLVGLILAGGSTEGLISDQELSKLYPVEITSLQISPAWQGKGIGRALIWTAMEQLGQTSGSGLLVRVLRDNPNIPFYEHLGAARLGSEPYCWEGYDTYEELLGWEDMSVPSGNRESWRQDSYVPPG